MRQAVLFWAPLLLPVAAQLEVVVDRPAASTWKRTQCGGPSGSAEIASKWGAEVSPSSQPLTAYPRPQMTRLPPKEAQLLSDKTRDVRLNGGPNWVNLNGLWEWEIATSDVPQFGKQLAGSILVPFPVESCLSGVAPQKSADIVKQMWYRLPFQHKSTGTGRTLLHFGAVDWQTSVYLNKKLLGTHTGGYDGFSFDITDHLSPAGNELLMYVYDPSDEGKQPNGKQRVSAIDRPGGDMYTPSSGIWQTVWLEPVPHAYIRGLQIDQASLTSATVTADVVGGGPVSLVVMDGDTKVASAHGVAGEPIKVTVPSPKLWSPATPNLYNLVVSAASDEVQSYFGLRTFTLGKTSAGNARPKLNGKFAFMAGFLDQSWWPDGQYTAPSDEALESDLIATKMFGLNMIRLHQKVNPELWYYHADTHGIAIFQDAVQKYGHANNDTIPLFVNDITAMVEGRGNHPSIVQWETFNEGDCWSVFKTPPYDVKGITSLVKQLDPARLVDTDSGGGANNFKYVDVNDIHSYPYPGDPRPSATQYAMVGEFGGIGAFLPGKEWVPGKCHTYLKVSTPADEASTYIAMAHMLQSRADHISASVYTQTTDVELECDGFLNYDRSNKFSKEDTKAIFEANQALIKAGSEDASSAVQIEADVEAFFEADRVIIKAGSADSSSTVMV